MSDYYLGEIRLFPYGNGKCPAGWMECAGQTLQINQYQAAYALLGTQYGGDGRTTFNLPDLRGRAIIGFGVMPDANRALPQGTTLNCGANGGAESVQLSATQIPPHSHTIVADSANATSTLTEVNSIPAQSAKPGSSATVSPPDLYGPLVTGKLQTLNPASIGNAGGGAAHENRQPFLPLMYCIAVTNALYPARN